MAFSSSQSPSISAASGTTTGSIAVTVTPGAPARLVVTTQPAGAASGVVLVTQPVVEVRDISDNLVTNAQIDVQASPTSGTLIGTTVVRTQQGVARFTDLGVSGTVGPRAIVFSAGSLANGVSGNFELTAGPLAAVGFVGTAPRVRSGIASGASVVAQLRDANGNAVARGGRQLTITVTGGTGTTTSSGTTAVTDGQGRATFPTFTVTGLAGQRTMTLRADSIAPVAVGTLILVGGAPTRVVVDRDLPTTIEAGVVMAPAPSVRLMDSVGNFAPEAGVTVTATSIRKVFERFGMSLGGNRNLLQIVSTGGKPAGFTSVLHGRQDQRDERANDGDNDEQFNDCEGVATHGSS
jgi:hypothetical protein